ncbi:putative lipid II flippase FtsW [Leeia sp. TBRC 13508]|uniref:Probable peptidoglycan glycosyltransferase FtsW n=1 Tax=Leeia speluncae TaxID=2884804 RepID=A0ABS8D5L4_9NEIS|nr:putative lipid II flippase FtsW [Leeia speluncae]MCB6183495.1 putative lipid II flippase FtsW [Leeia speluncae]
MGFSFRQLRNRPQPAGSDQLLIWSVLILLAIGLVMVYSASIAYAATDKDTGYKMTYYLLRQAIFLGVGFLAGFAAYQFPTRIWQQYAPYAFLFGLALLVLVLVPHVGREINGSRRWLGLVVINLQPSELMKLFAVLYAADYTVRKAAYMHSLIKGFVPMFMVMLITGGLLLSEPDFGAFAVITAIAMGCLFLGGLNGMLFIGLVVFLAIGFVGLVVFSPYRYARLTGFLDPWADPLGKGYQLSHSLIAFGRGEWLGVGLGGSVEKLYYLPEAHTDFLMAIVAEELGFVGVAVVIGLFVVMIWRIFAIGKQSMKLERYWSALAAYGVAIWLGVQSIINMGVNMGLLPTKGLTLPLMSFGGSGIVANLIALALVLRIDWESRQMMRGYQV